MKALALRLAPNLSIDREQLIAKGYSPNEYAVELAVVIENVFLELYSSIDFARKVVFVDIELAAFPIQQEECLNAAGAALSIRSFPIFWSPHLGNPSGIHRCECCATN